MSKLVIDKPKIGNLEGRAESIYKVVIDLLKNEKELRTFAIYGDWGSGKTSICYNIYEHFRLLIMESKPIDDSYIIPVWFEAWRFQHEQEIFPALLRIIGLELIQTIGNNTAGALGRKLIKSAFIISKSLLSGIKLNVPGIDFSAKDTFDQLDKELEKGDDSVITRIAKIGTSPYFEAFEILKSISNEIKLNNKKIRILLFIDDLDRCLPDVAFKIIEQLKIWLDIDGYTICMALKKSEIEKVVDKYLKTSLDIKPPESIIMAKDYLLKVISLGIYINEYHKDIKDNDIKDNDKTDIIKMLAVGVNGSVKDIISSEAESDPSKIRKKLKEKNKQIKEKYSFRKLLNIANEIYVENLILKEEKKRERKK